jgi:hypothetical protein
VIVWRIFHESLNDDMVSSGRLFILPLAKSSPDISLTHTVQNEFTLATSQNSFKNTAERKMEEISSLPLLE